MESRAQATTVSDWLRRYSRERDYRQQAEEVSRRLAERLPGLFVAAAPRPLNPGELDEVVSGLLAYCELLVAGVPIEGEAVQPATAAA